MKGFKATYNLKCKDVQFEVGKTYKIEGDLEICQNGFHFCQNIQDTLNYYDPTKNIVFLEVEALGKVITEGDKSCTNEIKIVRIIDKSEIDFIKWDENNNLIYFEYSDGFWSIQEFDKNNNQIYFEDSNGTWSEREYDKNNNQIYCEYSNGFWYKREFDNNNLIYFENSYGFWYKREFDKNNNEIYFESSEGTIIDNRPKKEISMDEIAAKFGIPVDQLKIKK